MTGDRLRTDKEQATDHEQVPKKPVAKCYSRQVKNKITNQQRTVTKNNEHRNKNRIGTIVKGECL